MSRFLLLGLFLTWMTWNPPTPISHAHPALITVFVVGYLAIVLTMKLLARRAISRRGFRKFHRIAFAARVAILVWLAIGVYLLHWGDFVHAMLGRVSEWPAHLPGAVIALAPAMLAWMGLWWAQYSVDHAANETNLSSLRSYFICNLRLQVLFTIARTC